MPSIRERSHGSDVTRLQLLLNSFVKPCPNLTPDGRFGPHTTNALMAFQRGAGIAPDGVCGPKTWTALGQKSTPLMGPHLPSSGAKWVDVAAAELGVHERSKPGQHNKRILEYHACTSLRATTDEVPWCSSFVNWVMKQAGHKGTSSALAASWLNWGTSLSNPRIGAIVVIKRKGKLRDAATGSGTGNHVGFYISSTPTHMRLLGGNQSGGLAVSYSNFALAAYETRGYRWP